MIPGKKFSKKLSVVLLLLVCPIMLVLSPPAWSKEKDKDSCPMPTDTVQDALIRLANRLERAGKGRSHVPMDTVHSIQREEFRLLTSSDDESTCRQLLENGHSKYLDKTWSDVRGFDIEGDPYPFYNAAYYEIGDYYFSLFVVTPTPQDNDPDEIRTLLRKSTAILYDQNFDEVTVSRF